MTRKIGAYTTVLSATPTIDTNVYGNGDLIGSEEIALALAVRSDGLRAASGIIQSVIVTDLGAQAADLDVYFFDTELTNTTFTDNGAWDVDDTDLLNLIGVAAVTDWRSLADNSNGQALNLGMPFTLLASMTTIYAVLISRGTPTYASTTDLTLRVAILQD